MKRKKSNGRLLLLLQKGQVISTKEILKTPTILSIYLCFRIFNRNKDTFHFQISRFLIELIFKHPTLSLCRKKSQCHMKSIKGNLRAEADVGWPDVPIFQTMLFSYVLRLNNLFFIPFLEAVPASFDIRAVLRNPSHWHAFHLPLTEKACLGKAWLSPRCSTGAGMTAHLLGNTARNWKERCQLKHEYCWIFGAKASTDLQGWVKRQLSLMEWMFMEKIK